LTNKLATSEQTIVEMEGAQDALRKCNDEAAAQASTCQETQASNDNLKELLEKCNRDTLADQSSHASAIIDVERKLLKMKEVHKEEIKKLEFELKQLP